MTQNFLACDRDQELLLPPSLREWLPEGHLAWFVIDAVAALDLKPFYGAYRDNGQGRSAHDPAMMVALLLYCLTGPARTHLLQSRLRGTETATNVCAPGPLGSRATARPSSPGRARSGPDRCRGRRRRTASDRARRRRR